jgi:hypothetical protein
MRLVSLQIDSLRHKAIRCVDVGREKTYTYIEHQPGSFVGDDNGIFRVFPMRPHFPRNETESEF